MQISEYDRAVKKFLNLYGLKNTDVSIDSGSGGHRKCTFTYGGRQHTITLANSPRDQSAVHIKLGDIRRELGPPPGTAGRGEKIQKAPARRRHTNEEARLGSYAGAGSKRQQVRLYFPRAMGESVLRQAFEVDRIDDNCWRLHPTTTGPGRPHAQDGREHHPDPTHGDGAGSATVRSVPRRDSGGRW